MYTASIDFARCTSSHACTFGPLVWDHQFARVRFGWYKRHTLACIWSTSNISGYIRAIGDVVQEHTVSCPYLESIENTIGGLISMVSTWRMIRSAVFVSVLVTSVELAQPCLYGAYNLGYSTAPAVHACSNNDSSNSARTIMCVGTGADRRICMLASRDAPFK